LFDIASGGGQLVTTIDSCPIFHAVMNLVKLTFVLP